MERREKIRRPFVSYDLHHRPLWTMVTPSSIMDGGVSLVAGWIERAAANAAHVAPGG